MLQCAGTIITIYCTIDIVRPSAILTNFGNQKQSKGNEDLHYSPCSGCPHLSVFTTTKFLGVFVLIREKL